MTEAVDQVQAQPRTKARRSEPVAVDVHVEHEHSWKDQEISRLREQLAVAKELESRLQLSLQELNERDRSEFASLSDREMKLAQREDQLRRKQEEVVRERSQFDRDMNQFERDQNDLHLQREAVRAREKDVDQRGDGRTRDEMRQFEERVLQIGDREAELARMQQENTRWSKELSNRAQELANRERDFAQREERCREDLDLGVARLREEEEKLRSRLGEEEEKLRCRRKQLDEREMQHIQAFKEANVLKQPHHLLKHSRGGAANGGGKENQELKRQLEEQKEKLQGIKRQPGTWASDASCASPEEGASWASPEAARY